MLESSKLLLSWSLPEDLHVGVRRPAGRCLPSEVLWVYLGAGILCGIGKEKTDIRRRKIRDEQDTNSVPAPQKHLE